MIHFFPSELSCSCSSLCSVKCFRPLTLPPGWQYTNPIVIQSFSCYVSIQIFSFSNLCKFTSFLSNCRSSLTVKHLHLLLNIIPTPLRSSVCTESGGPFSLTEVLYFWHAHDDVIKWKHFPRHWPFVRGIHGHRWIPFTKASHAKLGCFLWSASE